LKREVKHSKFIIKQPYLVYCQNGLTNFCSLLDLVAASFKLQVFNVELTV